MKKLKVVLIKPSKYGFDGYVERFRLGYMPNATLWHMKSMTPTRIGEWEVEVQATDEMIEPNLSYLDFSRTEGCRTLVALVGVQIHQFHRALDIAALAREHGAMAIIGGPYPMTCNTEEQQGRGISFSLAEAELVWNERHILGDAITGELKSVYGQYERWAKVLQSSVVDPPPKSHLRRYPVPVFGLYPARGCPFRCDFCSVIQVAGRVVRSQPVEVTIESIRRAKKAGVKILIFTSDNFNKYAEVPQLLDAMIEEDVRIPFFCQCDTQIVKQEWLVEKMRKAGCAILMVGAESLDRETLLRAKKTQNHPDQYQKIVKLCRRYGISPYFSNIIGFLDDTSAKIKRNVQELKRIGPSVSWFYILTPGPGTEQYESFMAQGLITETNLDRFDATYPTWTHPSLTHQELLDLLYYCYDEFYSSADTLHRLFDGWHAGISLRNSVVSFLYSTLCRIKSRQRVHPMIGGLMQFSRDHVRQYIERRKKVFRHEFAPLPPNLPPASADMEYQDHHRGHLLKIENS